MTVWADIFTPGGALDYHLLTGSAIGSAAYVLWRPVDADGGPRATAAWKLALVWLVSFVAGIVLGDETVGFLRAREINIGPGWASMIASAAVLNLAHLVVRNTSSLAPLLDVFRRGRGDGGKQP